MTTNGKVLFERACLVMVLTMEAGECPDTQDQAEHLMAISCRVFQDMTATYNPPDIAT